MCGIVGIYHKKQQVCTDIYDGLIQVQHRGQDAAGIATWDSNKMYTCKTKEEHEYEKKYPLG